MPLRRKRDSDSGSITPCSAFPVADDYPLSSSHGTGASLLCHFGTLLIYKIKLKVNRDAQSINNERFTYSET